MNFENCNKLWPFHVDILNGPIFEGDDDDDDDINVTSLSQLQNEIFSERSVIENLPDDYGPITADGIIVEKTNTCHKNSLSDIFNEERSFSSLNKAGLGTLVYMGNKGESAKESDEEVDVETIDEEVEISSNNKRCSSHSKVNGSIGTDVVHVKKKDLAISSMDFQPATQSVKSLNQNLNDEQDIEMEDITVLEANDVVSLLEQFEASEGITSQEIKSLSSPKRLSSSCDVEFASFPPSTPLESLQPSELNATQPHSADVPSKNGKSGSCTPEVKDVSIDLIQKIKMASSTKKIKGSILITPPSHKRKPRSKCLMLNGHSEKKKSNRSSGPKAMAAACRSIAMDHDYCSTFVHDSAMKLENVKPYKSSSYSNPLIETNGNYIGDECTVTSHAIKISCVSPIMEANYVPDAQVEVEIVDSVAGIESQEISALEYLGDSNIKNSLQNISTLSKFTVDEDKNIEFKASARKDEAIITTVSKSLTKLPLSRFPCKSPPEQCSENKHSTFSHSPQISHKAIIIDEQHSPNPNVNAPCNRSPVWGKHLFDDFCNSRSPSPCKKPCIRPASGSNSPSWPSKSSSPSQNDLWKSPRAACVDNNGRNFWKSEKQKQIEERRVVYVGKIVEGTTVSDIRDCFVNFGPIQDISVHFRDNGDNYGFVTFFDRNDAYEVVERGNRDPNLRSFDLCFGGRRQFCKTRYADLDFSSEDPTSWSSGKNDFDTLLQKAKANAQTTRRQSVVSQ